MKLSYRITVSQTWTTIFDTSVGDTSKAFKPSFKDAIMTTQGFGALSESIIPLANTLVTLPIACLRLYNSRQEALAGIRALRSLKGQRFHLQVTESGEQQYYPNAGLESMSANLNGQAVDYDFVFQTQDLTQIPPA